MTQLLLAGASLLCLASPAFAQLPEPLEAALSVDLMEADLRQVEMRIGTNQARITVRMIEDESGGVDYTLLSPPEATLNEDQAELWQELADAEGDETLEEGQEADEESGFESEDFDPEEMRRIIGNAAHLVREEGGMLVYSFQPQAMPDEDEAEGEDRDPAVEQMLENLSGEVDVSLETGHISSFRLMLTESFKPNFAARIEDFQMIQNYVFDEVVNGPRLSGMRFSVTGSAAFQSFEESMIIDILSVQWDEPSVDASTE